MNVNDPSVRQQLASDVQTTFQNLRGLLSAFNDAEIDKIPFAGSWSAGQLAEHVIKSTHGIPDTQTTGTNRPADEQVQAIKDMFLNYNSKYDAAPFLQPEKQLHNKNELLQTLEDIEAVHIEIANNKDLSALCLDMELPVFGQLTRYEWVRFVLCHTQRHTHQLQNIRAKLNG